jgi:magnesium transporter
MLLVRGAGHRQQSAAVDLSAVSELLRRGSQSLWFEIDTPEPGELAFLEKELEIHHLTLEDVVKQGQRPKIESFEDYVYLTIHPLEQKNGLEIEPTEVDLLLGRNWLVLVHYGPVPSLQGPYAQERLSNALGRGADFLLYTVVDLIVDSYFPILDQIDEAIDDLEDRLLESTDREDMAKLLTLKRSLVHIRRALGPQREIFNQLTRRDFPFVSPECTFYFRDVYDHLIRITEELDSLRDILSGALEIHPASTSNQLNQTMKRLAAWGTILIVITTIAGIYGMNFEYMPELRWRFGYLGVLTLMASVSFGLYYYFRRKDFL